MRLSLLLLLSVMGCQSVRPLTRTEYGLDRFQAHGGKPVTAQYIVSSAGIRVKAGPVNVDLLAGPIVALDNRGGSDEGIHFDPGLSWFPKEGTSVILDIDYTLYSGGDYDSSLFVLFSLTQEW